MQLLVSVLDSVTVSCFLGKGKQGRSTSLNENYSLIDAFGLWNTHLKQSSLQWRLLYESFIEEHYTTVLFKCN